MKIALVLSASIFSSTLSRAQTPQQGASPDASAVKPVLPAGSLLRPAAEFSRWEITFTYTDDKKKDSASEKSEAANTKNHSATPDAVPDSSSNRPRKILVTKTKRIIHIEQTDMSNRKSDAWFNGSTKYMKDPSGSAWMPLDPVSVAHTGQAVNYDPLPASGFRGLELVKDSNYAGSIEYGGTTCLVFVLGGYKKVNLQDGAKGLKQLDTEEKCVYIGSETRLPVAVRTRGELQSFHFDSQPTAMQTLPADLLAEIKQADEARARLLQPAARPY